MLSILQSTFLAQQRLLLCMIPRENSNEITSDSEGEAESWLVECVSTVPVILSPSNSIFFGESVALQRLPLALSDPTPPSGLGDR